MTNLLEQLIIVSEKAANIARACRQEQNLFALLIEEKKSGEANPRFFQDFKTLADVLIQETIRFDLSKHFKSLTNHIRGEEVNSFTNALGETISIEIQDYAEGTAELLKKILDGDERAAHILATEVHRNVTLSNVHMEDTVFPTDIEIDLNKVGIWIDPIDSTAEYINGVEKKSDVGIYLTGLRCVTVLIGAYNLETGIPVIGVINQPFHREKDNNWHGFCYWGLCTPQMSITSLPTENDETKIVVLSRIELDSIKAKLKDYTIVEAAGAGYKLLSVITGHADAYINSQGTTFKWDLCGPHAIFRALEGEVLEYNKFIDGKSCEIDYQDNCHNDIVNQHSNKNGIIATRNKTITNKLIQLLSE